MANSTNRKKLSGGSRKPSGTKANTKTSGRRAPEPEPEESFLPDEVFILVAFAVAVLLFLSNFRLCGSLGEILRSVQLGLFGMIGFAAPILLFVGTCFLMANRGSALARVKLIAVLAGVWVLSGLAELVFGAGYTAGQKLGDIYLRCAQTGLGGGFLGGLLVMGIGSLLGTIGAYLILIIALVICAVCITEKSVVSVVKRGGGKAYQYAKEDADRRRVIREEKKEERRRLREEQKVRGVDLSSTKLEDAGLPEDEEEKYEELSAEETEAADEDARRPEPARAKSGRGPKLVGEGPADFNPEVGNQGFMDELLPEEYKNRKERTQSSADIFTGNITRPPVYVDPEDDSVPFDADERAGEWIPGTVVPPVGLDGEPVLHVIDGRRGGLYDQGDDPETAGKLSEEGVLAEQIRADAASEERFRMERIAAERAAAQAASEEDTYSDEAGGYGPQSGDAWQEISVESPEDGRPAPKTRIVTGDAEVVGGRLTMEEGSRRVVTAGGKIIESDTEALQKKLESRRQEAKDEKTGGVAEQIAARLAVKKEYVFPPMNLLNRGTGSSGTASDKEYRETAIKLQQTLRDFGVGVTVTNVSCGPSVTRYELHPEQGVKVSRIVGLADDIKLSLAAADIRIEAPIPGKSAVGIEVPNKEKNAVYLRELLESEEFKKSQSKLTFAVGKDIGGQVVVTDIAKMPHLLIAGSTGSGKSVCINTLIMSIIYKSGPDDVKLIMVDPKVVELSSYNGIPHLLIPVVTDPKKASGALNWAVAEMDDRYKKFAASGVRDLKGYNAKVDAIEDLPEEKRPAKMPQIVIVIDELADLMMVAPGEVEDSICRLAQLARAAGIHLVIATQRPSVNVITGLIKANVPSRIAFAVSSGVDSRTILDMVGAEKLLGKGDMLFYPAGIPKPVRVQGALVSDSEVSKVVDFLKKQDMGTEYSAEIESQISMPAAESGSDSRSDRDEYFAQAGRFIIEKDKASIGMLQRMYKIGFNRAARIMDQLAEAGVVSEDEGTKPRKVLMTLEEFEAMLNG